MIIPNKRYSDTDTKEAKIANAVGAAGYVLSIGDAIQPGATGHNKHVVGAASSGLILGIVVSIKKDGKVVEVDSVTGVNTTSALAGALQVGNDNETLGGWSVGYIPAYVPMEYKVDASAALDTTTDSGGKVSFPILGTSATKGQAGTINEAAPGLFGASAQLFVSAGIATGSTTKVVGHIDPSFIF